MYNAEFVEGHLLSDKVNIELNVFCPPMMTGLVDMYTADTLSQKTTVAREGEEPSSPRSCRSHTQSATAFATARYSASALDRETMA